MHVKYKSNYTRKNNPNSRPEFIHYFTSIILALKKGLIPCSAFWYMLINNMPAIGIGGMGDMKDMQPCFMLFCKIQCLNEGDIGLFGKIRAKKDSFIIRRCSPFFKDDNF